MGRPSSIPRSVEAAARTFTNDLFSDHPAADLLAKVVVALARDVDSGPEVRDRVAAAKEMRAVISDLAAPADDGAGEADDDDIFGIGSLPPGVGDSATG